MGDGQLQPLITRLLHTVGMEGGHQSDAELLERFVRARDETAFESLLWRHGPMVLALCRRLLHNRHDAEDAFQAVFLVFFRKAPSIRRRDCVASWLYRVAYRVAVKARARTANRADHAALDESLPAPELPDAILTADVRAVLDDALSRLPEKYRLPLVLHYLQGRTVQQAATEIGCPPGTVSGRLNRARELLRRRLARRGVVLSGALVPAALARAGKAAGLTTVLTSATLAAIRMPADRPAAAGTVSAAARALAESAVRRLAGARWKRVTLVLLVLGLAGLGASQAGWRLLAPEEAHPPRAAVGPPAAPPAGAAKPSAAARDEDPLPQGARLRLGSQRFTYGAFIDALALSPDGATVAAVGGTNSVVFWDAATGKRRTIVSANDRPVPAMVCAVDFSPDGTDVVVGDDHGRAVVIPNWKTGGTEPGTCVDEHHQGTVRAVRFAPDGQTVASAGTDGAIRLWVPTSGQVLQTLTGHHGAVHALAWAPDGKTLASAGEDGTVRVWVPTAAAPPRVCRGHAGAVRALAFSTDGKVLASAGMDRRVLLWHPDADRAFGDYNLRTVVPLALVFLDAKRLAIGSEAGAIRLFDIEANQLLCNYLGFAWAVNALACSRDGRWLVAGGQDGVFLRWDVARSKADEHEASGHWGPVWCVDVSPDGGSIATGGLDGTVRLWDAASGRALKTYRPDWQTPRGLSYVSALAFVLAGQGVAAAGADGAIHLWDPQEGARFRWPAHRGKVTALVCCPGERFLVSAGEDGTVCRWRTLTGEKVATYGGAAGEVRNLAVSPDGERLAGVTADGTVHVWELATGRPLGTPAAKGSGLDLAAFAPDGSLVAVGRGSTLHWWRPTPGAPPDRWRDENSKAVALAFAPDETLALAGPDALIRLWRPNGAEVGRFAGHQTRINGLVFTPDGKSLVSASDDGTVLVWDVARR
jgi:RNA polymerase sigma factor (sigma-70 family)